MVAVTMFFKEYLTSLLPAYLHVGKLHVSSVIISAIVKTFRLEKDQFYLFSSFIASSFLTVQPLNMTD
jgi:hypothetical protein